MTTLAANETCSIQIELIAETEAVSVALMTLNGLNARVLNRRSTMTYQVYGGQGTMEVGGEFHDLAPGVTITITPGVPYQDEGNVTMLVTAEPPFDPRDVEYVS